MNIEQKKKATTNYYYKKKNRQKLVREREVILFAKSKNQMNIIRHKTQEKTSHEKKKAP